MHLFVRSAGTDSEPRRRAPKNNRLGPDQVCPAILALALPLIGRAGMGQDEANPAPRVSRATGGDER